ncbi:hypothetical protein [Streptomyces gobiensis]|uniref:hypothetical protein n=1 Tax=Streptomyces gobiensis TaxID=2875706 RepID=UPI001E29CABA|nr:hypothetical protein [Streptomyces gobiensis]UGY92018.1 hypothetical protein test1122_09980 [Streptomyces gobiensis]
MSIIHALIEMARALFVPRPTGRHRASAAPCRAVAVRRPVVVVSWDPPYLPWAPRGRSEDFIDGDATVMVRPYLVAYEQQERRAALALVGVA